MKYQSKALFTGRLKEASITYRPENYGFGSCMTDKLFQMSESFHTWCVPRQVGLKARGMQKQMQSHSGRTLCSFLFLKKKNIFLALIAC